MLSIATIMVLILGVNGCGESSDNREKNNEVKIDRAEYLPQSSETQNWVEIVDDSKQETRNTNYYDKKIVLKDNIISYETNNTIDIEEKITNDDIIVSYLITGDTEIENRNVALGESFLSSFSSSDLTLNGITRKIETTIECILEKKLDTFVADTQLNINYEGELIREKCTTKKETTFSNEQNETHISIDISYGYVEKNKGYLAFTDKDCHILDKEHSHDNQLYYDLNDSSPTCDIVINSKKLLLK